MGKGQRVNALFVGSDTPRGAAVANDALGVLTTGTSELLLLAANDSDSDGIACTPYHNSCE